MKTEGIPIWLTNALAFGGAFGLFVGLAAISGNGMYPFMDAAWGGRSIGVGLVAFLTIFFKSPTAYLIAFVSAIPREIGDLVQFTEPEPIDWSVVGVTAAFLIIWVYGAVSANRARVLLQ